MCGANKISILEIIITIFGCGTILWMMIGYIILEKKIGVENLGDWKTSGEITGKFQLAGPFAIKKKFLEETRKILREKGYGTSS